MTDYLYILGIVFAFLGMLIVDRRWKVAFFRDPGRSTAVVLLTFVLLVVFDIIGLWLGIYSAGDKVMGIFLGTPDFPLEEVFLLLFFGYFALIMLRIHK